MKSSLLFVLITLLLAGPVKAIPASDTLKWRPDPIRFGSLRFGAGGFRALNGEIGYGFSSIYGLLKSGTLHSELCVEFNGFKRSSLWGPKLMAGVRNSFLDNKNYEAGGNLCMILYCKEGLFFPTLRPEVVISFLTIFDLSYGYNFYLNSPPHGVYNTHTITLIMRPRLVLELMRADHH